MISTAVTGSALHQGHRKPAFCWQHLCRYCRSCDLQRQAATRCMHSSHSRRLLQPVIFITVHRAHDRTEEVGYPTPNQQFLPRRLIRQHWTRKLHAWWPAACTGTNSCKQLSSGRMYWHQQHPSPDCPCVAATSIAVLGLTPSQPTPVSHWVRSYTLTRNVPRDHCLEEVAAPKQKGMQ
jgi:hypothetical protein